MHNSVVLLIILLMVTLGNGCAHRPTVIPIAPNNNALAVVFDIDGTLTPQPLKFLEVRADAAKAVQLFANKGYTIIYLSARSSLLEGVTHDWLKSHGFPDGFIRVENTAADRQHPDQFKTRILRGFLANGWHIRYAYGDSSTDFKAYASVAIPSNQVFALRREDTTSCQEGAWEACLNGWTEHINFIIQMVQSVTAK